MNIAVIIPCYNNRSTVGRAIESVYAQTYSPQEIIVVDDGSTDDSCYIVHQFKDVKLVRQSNKGPASARNTGAAHSCADWLALLDADDSWMPNKLANQELVARRHNYEVGLIFARSNLSPSVPNSGAVNFADLWTANIIPCSSALVSRKVFDAVGGFDEDARLISNEDYNLWLRIALYGFSIIGCDEVLVHYRPGNLTNDTEAFLNASLFNITSIGAMAGKSTKEIRLRSARLLQEFGRDALWKRNLNLARRCFIRSFAMNPSAMKVILFLASSSPVALLDIARNWRSK